MKQSSKMGRPRRFDDSARITRLASENPRRDGTKAHANFKMIRHRMTVGAFMAAGGDMRDFRYMVDMGWLEVS